MDAVLAGLSSLFEFSTLIYLLFGVIAGLVVGVIPGLGGTAAVAVLLPFVFVLDAPQAMALIIGAVAVVHHSDAIASIVLGIPGSAAASVLLLDGHEMTKQGKGAKALSIAFMASMFGGVIGAIGLTASIPIARPLVLLFGSPEIFMLTILGISLTALLSKGNIVKGLIAGAFGVLLGQVGAAPASPEYRFTFGSIDLSDGLDLVAVALGIFGIAEIMHLIAKKTSVASGHDIGTGWFEGIKEFFPNFWHVIRGAFVGIWAGVLPGIGATAGTWMAYGQAQATAKGKDRKKFGKGDARGIIAPESAANSTEAGDLIPTLLFGIPGGAPTALLLGALLIFGIEPGPRIITDHLDTIYVIVWSFAIASVLGSLLCFVIAKPLAKLSYIRFPLLAAGLIPILFMAAYQGSLQLSMLMFMLILGAAGWFMKEFSYPRAPFLIGFVLSIPMERYFYLTDNLYDLNEWVLRPGVLVMIAILLIPVITGIVRTLRNRVKGTNDEIQGVSTEQSLNDDLIVPQKMGVVIAGIFFVIFAAAFIASRDYAIAARLMPTVISLLGAALSLAGLILEWRKLKDGPERTDEQRAKWTRLLRTTLAAAMWLFAFVVFVYVFGFVIAVALFMLAFLLLVARSRWWRALIYTALIVALMLVAEVFAGVQLPDGYIYLGI